MQSKSLQILCDDAAVQALCQSCGACCATCRVSFYWTETTAHESGQVPVEMTEQVNWFQSCMKGSSASSPRCCALKGEIGQSVGCSIYANRSSTCREYEVFDAQGQLNPRCNPARAKHGLEPLNVMYVPAQSPTEPVPQL